MCYPHKDRRSPDSVQLQKSLNGNVTKTFKTTRLEKQVQKLVQKRPKQLPKQFGDRRGSKINYPSNYRKSLATEKVQIQIAQQLQKQAWRQHLDTNSKPVRVICLKHIHTVYGVYIIQTYYTHWFGDSV